MKKIHVTFMMVVLFSAVLMGCGGDDSSDTGTHNNQVTTSNGVSLIGYWFTTDYKDYDISSFSKDAYACACMHFVDNKTVRIYDEIISATSAENPLNNSTFEWFEGRPGWMSYYSSNGGIYNSESFTYTMSGNEIRISCGRILTINRDGSLTLKDANTDWIKSAYKKMDYLADTNKTDEVAKEMAKYVSADITESFEKDNVSANIHTTLESQYPGKKIKYGMKVGMSTTWSPSYYIPKMLIVVAYDCNTKENYASGSGQEYTVSTNYPMYLGTGIDTGYDLFLEDPEGYTVEDVLLSIEVLRAKRKKIEDGTADECDMEDYKNLMQYYYIGYNSLYYNKVQCVVEIFVEVDGERHVVIKKESKANMPFWV